MESKGKAEGTVPSLDVCLSPANRMAWCEVGCLHTRVTREAMRVQGWTAFFSNQKGHFALGWTPWCPGRERGEGRRQEARATVKVTSLSSGPMSKGSQIWKGDK